MGTRSLALTAMTALVALAGAAAPGSSAPAAACGLPDATPVWIDYGEGSLTPDVRAVFARPGVVVSTSGTGVPGYFRGHGAATTYFVLHLPTLVGDPGTPADPASIASAASSLLAKATASTGCATPWITLNELLGASAAAPWSASTAQYRADVLALMQQLAAGGAHPVLLVHGDPNVTGDAADWWRQVGQAGDIVYEAYYDAAHIYSLGALIGNRRMRTGMRSVIALFESVGVSPQHLGLMLGFHSAHTAGIGGRQGLEPREAWLRVVKWEALAARQVTQDAQTSSIWSWGWGTFGPESADPDKAAAACVYLWVRSASLCDGPGVGGPAFDTSLVEGQIVLPRGDVCSLAGGRIAASVVTALAALTRDRHTALTAAFARASLQTAAPVTDRQVAAAEHAAVVRSFHGSQAAYLRALARAHATLGVARGIIRDELRRRAIAVMLTRSSPAETTLQWTADREAKAADTAICLQDFLPGSGDFPRSDAREIGVVPLPALLPFLFRDRTAPAAPAGAAATPAPAAVSLAWSYGPEPDLAGYEVLRAAASGGPYTPLTTGLLTRPAYVDATAPPDVPSYYVIRAVDTSGNESAQSAEVSATPVSVPGQTPTS